MEKGDQLTHEFVPYITDNREPNSCLRCGKTKEAHLILDPLDQAREWLDKTYPKLSRHPLRDLLINVLAEYIEGGRVL